MAYKMYDVVRITGLPRTTIQGYYDKKKKKSRTGTGGGGPQWMFDEEELEDLFLIKICLSIGKNKNEIEILRNLPLNEKHKHLKDMLDQLQNYINMANLYVEARPVIKHTLSKKDISLEAVKLISDIWTEYNKSIEQDNNIFEYQLSDIEIIEVIDILTEISNQREKVSIQSSDVQYNLGYIDSILDKTIIDRSCRKYLLELFILIIDDISVDKRKFVSNAITDYYGDTESIDSIIYNIMESIYDYSSKIGYTSSIIQQTIEKFYMVFVQMGLNRLYINRYFILLRDFFGSNVNINKYENGVEKGFMWYFSKTIETFIHNNLIGG